MLLHVLACVVTVKYNPYVSFQNFSVILIVDLDMLIQFSLFSYTVLFVINYVLKQLYCSHSFRSFVK